MEAQGELVNHNTESQNVFMRVGNSAIFRPQPAAIPLEEGLHFVVGKPNEQRSWQKQDIPEFLKESYFALGVAKIIAEGRYTNEFLANIHFNARPGFNTGVNVYGRNPLSEDGWGNPVRMRENLSMEPLWQEQEEKLRRELELYIPFWERELASIEVFDKGVNPLSSDSEEFNKLVDHYKTWNQEVVWANDKFVVINNYNPHLTGLHLMVDPKDSYWQTHGGFGRTWQADPEHITGFLEATAILLETQKILQEQTPDIVQNSEIHYSGNWKNDLQPVEKGGKFFGDYVTAEDFVQQRKAEKRLHRVGGLNPWDISFHGHLYATTDPGKYVELPTRPKGEVPQQWQGIARLPDNKMDLLRKALQESLTGKLISVPRCLAEPKGDSTQPA